MHRKCQMIILALEESTIRAGAISITQVDIVSALKLGQVIMLWQVIMLGQLAYKLSTGAIIL